MYYTIVGLFNWGNMTADARRSRNFRGLVIVLGVTIILCSLAALAYAFGPVQGLSEQVPLAPTLFAPP